MSQIREEIFSTAQKSLHVLRTMEQEHNQYFNSNLCHNNVDNLISSSSSSSPFNSLSLHKLLKEGIFTFEMLLEVAEYVECLEGDSAKHRNQLRRLVEENAWIREELCTAQSRLIVCEARIAELEVQLEEKQFMDNLANQTTQSLEEKVPSTNELGKVNTTDWAAGTTDSEAGSGNMPSSGYEMPGKLRTLHNLVVQYASQGRYEVAVPLCKQALEDLEKSNGRDHPDVATMLNILALVYRDQGKFSESALLLNDALVIRERTLGNDHLAVASTLNNLAVLYGKLRKYQEAETLCKKALVIREKALGFDHPDVAKQLNNLALICASQNKHNEVELYYKKAMEIYQMKLGKLDMNVIKTKISLSNCYMKQGKYVEAEEMYKDVLTCLHEMEHGPNTTTSTTTTPTYSRPIWMEAEAAEEAGYENSPITINGGGGAPPPPPPVPPPTPLSNSSIRISTSLLFSPYLVSSSGGGKSSGGIGQLNIYLDSGNMNTILRNLSTIYRRQGKVKAALKLEELINNKQNTSGTSSTTTTSTIEQLSLFNNCSASQQVQTIAMRPSLPASIIVSSTIPIEKTSAPNSYARVASSGVPAGVVLGVSSFGLQNRSPHYLSQPQLDRMNIDSAAPVVLRTTSTHNRGRSSAAGEGCAGGGGGGGWWRNSRNSLHLPNEKSASSSRNDNRPLSVIGGVSVKPNSSVNMGYGELKKSCSMSILSGGGAVPHAQQQDHRKFSARRFHRGNQQAPSPSGNNSHPPPFPVRSSPSSENVGFGFGGSSHRRK